MKLCVPPLHTQILKEHVMLFQYQSVHLHVHSVDQCKHVLHRLPYKRVSGTCLRQASLSGLQSCVHFRNKPKYCPQAALELYSGQSRCNNSQQDTRIAVRLRYAHSPLLCYSGRSTAQGRAFIKSTSLRKQLDCIAREVLWPGQRKLTSTASRNGTAVASTTLQFKVA